MKQVRIRWANGDREDMPGMPPMPDDMAAEFLLDLNEVLTSRVVETPWTKVLSERSDTDDTEGPVLALLNTNLIAAFELRDEPEPF